MKDILRDFGGGYEGIFWGSFEDSNEIFMLSYEEKKIWMFYDKNR